MSCSNNLKQIGLALANYESVHRVWPPGRMGCDGWTSDVCTNNPGYQRPGTSGFVMLLPQLDLKGLYELFEPFAKGAVSPAAPGDSSDGTTNGWKTPEIDRAMRERPAVFVCPSDTSEPMRGDRATCSYALCQGSNGPSLGMDQVRVKHYNTGVFMYRTVYGIRDVTDGLSHTIFAGETIEGHTRESYNSWTVGSRHLSCMRSTENPINTPPGTGIVLTAYGYSCNGAFASRHPGGAMFTYGDGHVAFLSEDMDLPTYQALSTRAGGEMTTPEDGL
jgi:prepilin-type processing-associated H-X9-DG protein